MSHVARCVNAEALWLGVTREHLCLVYITYTNGFHYFQIVPHIIFNQFRGPRSVWKVAIQRLTETDVVRCAGAMYKEVKCYR